MALTYRTLYRNCYYINNITKPVKSGTVRNQSLRFLSNSIVCRTNILDKPLIDIKQINLLSISKRACSTRNGTNNCSQEPEQKKPGLIQRFKQMYRDYWYVLVPVHMATSAIWFGGFYYAVRR